LVQLLRRGWNSRIGGHRERAYDRLTCWWGWKIFSELLRPIAGEAGWEFVERASTMVAPFALLLVIRRRSKAEPAEISTGPRAHRLVRRN
jgi:hypothetical protein